MATTLSQTYTAVKVRYITDVSRLFSLELLLFQMCIQCSYSA